MPARIMRTRTIGLSTLIMYPKTRRTNLSPSERKRIAQQAAAARWGTSPADTVSIRGPYAELEPRDAVLTAAIRIFAVRGYEAPTLKEIAAAAEVGLQTIYRFHPTKRDLYLSACAQLLEGQMRYMGALMMRNQDPAEQIYALALGLSETHIRPDLIRLIHRELLDPDSDIADAVGRGHLATYFDQYFRTAQRLHLNRPKQRILALITTIMGFVQLLPVRQSLPVLQDIAHDVETVALFGLEAAFPDIDWKPVRARVTFEQFDLDSYSGGSKHSLLKTSKLRDLVS